MGFLQPRTRSCTWAFLLCTCVIFLGCQSSDDNRGQPEDATTSAGPLLPGKQLARAHCQSCHKLPQPSALDKQTWRSEVLPRMARRLGLYDGGERPDSLFEDGVAGQLVREANVFPDTQRLSREKWEAIQEYYVREAPRELPKPSRSEITTGLETFQLHVPPFRREPPLTSLVNIQDTSLYVGDAGARSDAALAALDDRFATSFQKKRLLPVSSAPSSMHIDGSTLHLSLMGRLDPTDAPSGRIVRRSLQFDPPNGESDVTLIDSLQRPSDATYANLTDNGLKDIVVSEFGYRTGGLTWFEHVEKDQHMRHTLRNAAGVVESFAHDFTSNGRPDVMALMAQGDEGIFLYHNKGDGTFEEERVLRFPSSYGSSSFELVDFNEDGAMDILYAAGDNADFEPVMRPYHGIRLFLNDGDNNFEEEYFFPMNGAYGTVARDFDGGGDLDIAAISFSRTTRIPPRRASFI